MKASDFPWLSRTGMVLAAGLGKRLRPLTLEIPKPLVEVAGRSMLDHALDKLVAFGIERVVVNVHYLGDQIEAHLAFRRDAEIIFSRETELLETGGGVKKALPFFEGKPFFELAADIPWFDVAGAEPALERLAKAWNPSLMDDLLLMMPQGQAHGFGAKGDFMMEKDGRLWRCDAAVPRSHDWISTMLLKPSVYDDIKETAFSNNLIFDLLEERRRLYGVAHKGSCYHVGTPADLAAVRSLLPEPR